MILQIHSSTLQIHSRGWSSFYYYYDKNFLAKDISGNLMAIYVIYQCLFRSKFLAAPLIYYGLQHFLSLAGSLVFIPLIMVPAMGGTDVSYLPQIVSSTKFEELYGLILIVDFQFHLTDSERYCHNNFDYATTLWNHYNTSIIPWYPASSSTRKLICVFGSSSGYNECAGLSQPD